MNKTRIIEVLERAELLIDEVLAADPAEGCESPGHCAIGELLFAAGMDNAELRRLDNDPESFWWTDWVADEREPSQAGLLLTRTYDLTLQETIDIVGENDAPTCSVFREMGDEDGPVAIGEKRLQCVIDFVRSYVTEGSSA